MNKEDLAKIIVAASIARNDIVSYINKNNKAPKTRIKSLEAFQNAEGTLDVDGYYGPNSEAALTFYLSKMKDPYVPKSSPAFAKTPVTWKPPTIIEPKQEAILAKPAKPKPKPKATKPKKEKGGLGALGSIKFQKPKKKKESIKKSIEKITETPRYGQEPVINTNRYDAEEIVASCNLATIENNIAKIAKSNKDINSKLSNVTKKVNSLKNFDGVAITKKGNLRLLGLIL